MRDRFLDSLKALGDALVDLIINLMMDSDREVRLMAPGRCQFEDPRCVQPIMSLLDDEDWWTRLTAVETLDEAAINSVTRRSRCSMIRSVGGDRGARRAWRRPGDPPRALSQARGRSPCDSPRSMRCPGLTACSRR